MLQLALPESSRPKGRRKCLKRPKAMESEQSEYSSPGKLDCPSNLAGLLHSCSFLWPSSWLRDSSSGPIRTFLRAVWHSPVTHHSYSA